MRPELFIEIVRDSNPSAKELYTKGGCYKFFKILEAKYPGAEAYYDGNHVITKIEGEYFDVTGKVSKIDHLRMSQVEQDDAETWQTNLNITGMLNKETIDKLGKAIGIDAEELAKTLTSEGEQSLEIPEGQFFTNEEITKRDNNEYNKGKVVGAEKLVKETRDALGFDFKGSNINDLLDHVKQSAVSEIGKDKSEWQKDLEKQKETYETEILAKESKITELQNQFTQQRVTNKLLSYMPKETTIKSDAIITLFNANYGIVEEDGQLFVTQNGNKLKDPKTADPFSIEKVFNDFVTTEGYAKPPSGRGGGNDTGADNSSYSSTTPEAFEKEWRKNNPDKETTSPDFMKDYSEFRKSQQSA